MVDVPASNMTQFGSTRKSLGMDQLTLPSFLTDEGSFDAIQDRGKISSNSDDGRVYWSECITGGQPVERLCVALKILPKINLAYLIAEYGVSTLLSVRIMELAISGSDVTLLLTLYQSKQLLRQLINELLPCDITRFPTFYMIISQDHVV